MPPWRDGEGARVEACRRGRDCELRVPVGVRWKEEEEENRVPCDLLMREMLTRQGEC
jgi:hypothetical protein